MYFTEFQVHNYKSFMDSGVITLKPGFNIITGQNNAGKTALLEALGLGFSSRPHRSAAAAPANKPAQAHSWARLRFRVTRAELEDFLSNREAFFIPRAEESALGADALLRLVLDQLHLEIEARWDGQKALPARVPSFGVYRAGKGFFRAERNGGATPVVTPVDGELPPDSELGLALAPLFASRIYSFRAERLNVGRSRFGLARHLAPDASNLPEVLNVLQGHPARFERYNQLVRRVFPHIQRVTVRPAGESEVEILVWSAETGLEREDLAIPLAESGTGVGQVLAILYVLATADHPRVIIIDEPSSFLHPGSAHALIEILREHPQHQYIVSTHSPEVISASSPTTVHVLRKKGATSVEPINANAARHLRATLLEVGSRLSDVFGADGVLWVEGKTEEQCFPIIARKLLKRSVGRVAIVGVRPAGEQVDPEDTEAALRLYERLSQGAALLPPAIGFVFDRELRSEKSREDLIRESKGKVSFLPRRAYENYLLHPGAVAAVLNGTRPFLLRPTNADKVEAWMKAHASDERYYRKSSGKDFHVDINAPRFLSDLFADFSLGEFEYIKTEHSVAITEWLIEHEPKALKEVADLLASKLPSEAP